MRHTDLLWIIIRWILPLQNIFCHQFPIHCVLLRSDRCMSRWSSRYVFSLVLPFPTCCFTAVILDSTWLTLLIQGTTLSIGVLILVYFVLVYNNRRNDTCSVYYTINCICTHVRLYFPFNHTYGCHVQTTANDNLLPYLDVDSTLDVVTSGPVFNPPGNSTIPRVSNPWFLSHHHHRK